MSGKIRTSARAVWAALHPSDHLTDADGSWFGECAGNMEHFCGSTRGAGVGNCLVCLERYRSDLADCDSAEEDDFCNGVLPKPGPPPPHGPPPPTPPAPPSPPPAGEHWQCDPTFRQNGIEVGCNVCSECCKEYISNGASCDTCVSMNCPAHKCSGNATSPCTVCAACCHSYIPDGAACDTCVSAECKGPPPPPSPMEPPQPVVVAVQMISVRLSNENCHGSLASCLPPCDTSRYGWLLTLAEPGYSTILMCNSLDRNSAAFAWTPLGNFSHVGFYGGHDPDDFVSSIKSAAMGNYSLFLDGEFNSDTYTTCVNEMAAVCDSPRLQSKDACLLCTGLHQDDLKHAGCTDPLIVEFCSNNEVWGGKPRHDGRNGTMPDLTLNFGQIVNINGNRASPIVWGGGFRVPAAAEAHLMGIQLGKNNQVLEGGKIYLDHVEFRGMFDCPKTFVPASNQVVSSCSCLSGNRKIDRNPPNTEVWAINFVAPCNQVWLLQVQGQAFLNGTTFRDLAFDTASENNAIRVMNGGFVKVTDSVFSNIIGAGAIRVQDDGCFNSRNCDVRKFPRRGLDTRTTLIVDGSEFSWIDSTFVNVSTVHRFSLGYSAIHLDVGTAGQISNSEFRSNNASGCVSGGAGTVYLNLNSSAHITASAFVDNQVWACDTPEGGAGAIAIMNQSHFAGSYDPKEWYNGTVLAETNQFSHNTVVAATTTDQHRPYWPLGATYKDAAVNWPNHVFKTNLSPDKTLYTNLEAAATWTIMSGYH